EGGAGAGAATAAGGNGSRAGPAARGPPSWRLVAGHTAHGVYKDWPAGEAVLLSLTEVPELRCLELETHRGVPYLRIGAAVTLELLAAQLQELAAAATAPYTAPAAAPTAAAEGDPTAAGGAGKPPHDNSNAVSGSGSSSAARLAKQLLTAAAAEAERGAGECAAECAAAAAAAEPHGAASCLGGVRQWAAETSAHLRRIAGPHVRNAASVGGNLVMAAERALPSDVATVLGAAGAEVELRLVAADAPTHGSVVRANLVDFVAARGMVPSGCGYILTAIRVPLPPADPRVKFWSQRIAERYSNAAAVANAAVMVRLAQPTAAATDHTDGGPAVPMVEDVRIIIGVRTAADRGGGAGGASGAQKAVAAHNARKLQDASALLLDGWLCRRAAAAEAALRGRPASVASVAAALAALVGGDLAATAAAGTPAAAVAEGLVAQGLMACLGLAVAAGGSATAAEAGGGCGRAGEERTAPSPARMAPPSLVAGRQSLPDPVDALAPVTQPLQKLGAKLQASGTAHYTEDAPLHSGALYGAFVLSSRAAARVAAVDATAALVVPGVVRWLGAADLQDLPGAVNRYERAPPPPPAADAGAGGGSGGGDMWPSGPEPVFLAVGERCAYAGQPVGLVLATSPWAAQRGAKAVTVQYSDKSGSSSGGGGGDTGTGPLLSIADGVRAGSFHRVRDIMVWCKPGSSYEGNSIVVAGGGSVQEALAEAGAVPAAAVAEAALGGSAAAEAATASPPPPPSTSASRVVSGRYSIPSQLHFYMETQSAVAWPDEDGSLVVHSSCQGPDMVQAAVATALGLPYNKVTVRCRRVGGAFGGKATLSRRVAVAAAVAAAATGRQVRIQVPRNVDAVMNGGRCDVDVSYVAVVSNDTAATTADCSAEATHGSPTAAAMPRLRALDIHAVLLGGAFLDLSWLDVMGLTLTVEGLYDIPAIRAEVALTRCHLPPRTAVRGPGEVEGTMIIEQIMEHVAAELEVDPEAFRAANFLRCPDQPQQQQQQLQRQPPQPSALLPVRKEGDAAAAPTQPRTPPQAESPPRQPSPQQGEVEVEAGAGAAAAEAAGDGAAMLAEGAEAAVAAASKPETEEPASKPGEVTHGAAPPAPAPAPVVTSPLGKRIPARLYTLPRMWGRLMRGEGWSRVKAEVAAFNYANLWRKRGVALLPARYGMYRGRKPAYVSLLPDGTVTVACHGVEMGQGLFTKVAQVAAQTLSEALPPSQRPLDMRCIRIADNSTELLPNGGVTGGSTSSELSCVAVRLACLKLVEGLQKVAVPKMAGREDYTFKDLVAAMMRGPESLAPMSAFAWGGQADLPESSSSSSSGQGGGAGGAGGEGGEGGGDEGPLEPLEPEYHVMGVAGALVEVDVLTGERRVLRADVLFDLGRPVNPAVDLGQVEGAFVQGMGMMLHEKALYDGGTGALVHNSTWNYKVPAAACAPEQLNVTILNDAPLITRGPVGSKACGEPPLLLSCVVLLALQRAAAAARRDAAGRLAGAPPGGPQRLPRLPAGTAASVGAAVDATAGIVARDASNGAHDGSGGGGGGGKDGPSRCCGAGRQAVAFRPLLAPASVERVRVACGDWRAAELLLKADL
ncbi:hypothetical protein Agub_g7710, partial [Astrephomene gubernaculifera]